MINLWNEKYVFNDKVSMTKCNPSGPDATSIFSSLPWMRYLVMGNDEYNSYGGKIND